MSTAMKRSTNSEEREVIQTLSNLARHESDREIDRESDREIDQKIANISPTKRTKTRTKQMDISPQPQPQKKDLVPPPQIRFRNSFFLGKSKDHHFFFY